ncbi:MAG: AI-2E family transporter [Clostridium sp.]
MDRRYARLILNIVIPAVEILLVCLLGAKLLKFFMPFVIGWIIAMIANPLVRFLESRVKMVRKHSSVLIVVASAGPDYRIKLFSRLQTDSAGSGAGKDLPVLYDALSADLREISVRFASLFSRLPEQVQTNWQELAGSISHAASLVVQKIASPTCRSCRECCKRNSKRAGQCDCDDPFFLFLYCGAG